MEIYKVLYIILVILFLIIIFLSISSFIFNGINDTQKIVKEYHRLCLESGFNYFDFDTSCLSIITCNSQCYKNLSDGTIVKYKMIQIGDKYFLEKWN